MEVKSWLVARLVGDVVLMGVLGSGESVVHGFVGVPGQFPCLYYEETGNTAVAFALDGVWGIRSEFSFELYDRDSTAPLEGALEAVMVGLGYHRSGSRDSPQRSVAYTGRRVVYVRVLCREDME